LACLFIFAVAHVLADISTFQTVNAVCPVGPQADIVGLCEPLKTKQGTCNGVCNNPLESFVTNEFEEVKLCSAECQRLIYAFLCEFTCLSVRAPATVVCTTSVTKLFNECKACGGSGSNNIVGGTTTVDKFASDVLQLTLSPSNVNVNCVDFTVNARKAESTIPVITEIAINPVLVDVVDNTCVPPDVNPVTLKTPEVTITVSSLEIPTEVIVECIPPGAASQIPVQTTKLFSDDFTVLPGNTTPRRWQTTPQRVCLLGPNANHGTYTLRIVARNTLVNP
jgi:hypothetical protein